ncbi:hypothetical protein ACFPT7_14795 [Acidicapsa dinghuensis]|uniref:Uncharacterized protein n=1 Tax=Acidicapsa dinghuensis TaxID=2218256 RepID=A0ABW1EGX0_9BACT|nr:hypothetical protein [Acidicapsa dinghuensis]
MTSKGATWNEDGLAGNTGGGNSKRFLGFPLEGFGLFTSLLLTVSSGVLTFWLMTGVGIFGLLIWNQMLHHHVNYADSYLYVGLPSSIIVLVIAAAIFGTLWVRAMMARARHQF